LSHDPGKEQAALPLKRGFVFIPKESPQLERCGRYFQEAVLKKELKGPGNLVEVSSFREEITPSEGEDPGQSGPFREIVQFEGPLGTCFEGQASGTYLSFQTLELIFYLSSLIRGKGGLGPYSLGDSKEVLADFNATL